MRIKEVIALLSLLILPLLAMGCAGKKGPGPEHPGTDVNWPTLKGPGDFFGSLGRTINVMAFHRFQGRPVNTDWMGEAFVEKLCLTVTINNHCGGG